MRCPVIFTIVSANAGVFLRHFADGLNNCRAILHRTDGQDWALNRTLIDDPNPVRVCLWLAELLIDETGIIKGGCINLIMPLWGNLVEDTPTKASFPDFVRELGITL